MRDRIRMAIIIPPILVVMAMTGPQLWRALISQHIGIFSRASRGVRDIVLSEHPVEFFFVAGLYASVFIFCVFILLPRVLRLTFSSRPQDNQDRRWHLASLRHRNPSGFQPLWYGLAIAALAFSIYVAYGLVGG